MKIDEQKMLLNAKSEAAMDAYLRSKSWVEKVESIERMRAFSRIARAAMKKTLAEQTESTAPPSNPSE